MKQWNILYFCVCFFTVPTLAPRTLVLCCVVEISGNYWQSNSRRVLICVLIFLLPLILINMERLGSRSGYVSSRCYSIIGLLFICSLKSIVYFYPKFVYLNENIVHKQLKIKNVQLLFKARLRRKLTVGVIIPQRDWSMFDLNGRARRLYKRIITGLYVRQVEHSFQVKRAGCSKNR